MKLVLRLLGLLFVFAFLLATSISIALYYYEDEVKQFVVKSLNQQIRTEIKVSSIDLTFWNSFPHASVVFHDVVIHAVDAKQDTLLAAQKLGAQFNLLELYKRQYRLTGLQVENGQCKMIVDNSGRENYIFWESDSSQESSFQIDLERVKLENMQFRYDHYPNAIHLNFFIDKTALKGRFAKSIFELDIKASLEEVQIKNGDWTLVNQRSIKLISTGQVNDEEEFVAFQNAALSVDEMNFMLDGSIGYDQESQLLLNLKVENTSLEKALSLLPPHFRKSLAAYSVKGNASVMGKIKGSLSADKQPAYHIDFNVVEGGFKHQNSGFHFRELSLSGSVNNGKAHTIEETEINIEKLNTEFEGGQIRLAGRLKNLQQPQYELQSKLNFSFTDLIRFFEMEGWASKKGEINSEIKMSGKLKKASEFTLVDWKQAKVEGEMKLRELAFNYPGLSQAFSQLNGQISFQNNALQVDELSFNYGDNKMETKGRVNNLVGYLAEENETLLLDLELKSPALKIDDFLERDSTTNQENERGKIKIYLEPNIASLQYGKHKLKNFRSQVLWDAPRLDLRNTTFQYLDGQVQGDFFLREKSKGYRTYAKADLQNIDIKKLFNEFENFNQETVKSDHLEGTVTASIDYAANWSKKWKFDSKSLKVEANAMIQNGALINFKPLEKLSNYVELDELQNVRFKTLQNQILIQDERLHIPRFTVLTSALNLELEGTHTFSNQIDYRFELLLNEILGKKVKKPQNNEFGYVEDDGLGRTKVFMRMQGDLEDPNVSYDTEQLKSHLKQEVQKEKQTIKKLLNEEFGFFKKDSLSSKDLNNEEKKKSPFTVEWDEAQEKKSTQKTEKQTIPKLEEEKKADKKSKFGKFIDKIAQPNEDEYVEPKEN
ncbi:MAG: AsmA-like C-terminal region-containing protein [Vicingaceae bacterium]